MTGFDGFDDDTFERGLFAARARALPAPRLDETDVFARAARRRADAERRMSRIGARVSRAGVWVAAAACAAACALPVVRGQVNGGVLANAPERARHVASSGAEAFDAEYLACAAETTSRSIGACVVRDDATDRARNDELVCEGDVTFSSARP